MHLPFALSLRSVVPALLVGSLLSGLTLLAPAARAGDYTFTYSGGTVNVNGKAGGPFSVSSDGSTYSAGSGVNDFPNDTPNGSILIDQTAATATTPATTSPLTANFTWVSFGSAASDPPPSCAIVMQTCTASGGVVADPPGGDATGGGSANCGLLNAVSTPYTNGLSGASSTATSYSVQSPAGASFSVSDTPTASFTGYGGTKPGSFVYGGASVSYKVDAFPVSITLTGTLTDSNGNPILSGGNQQMLTGQQCTANFSIGLDQHGTSFTGKVTSYTWSFSGGTSGNPIKNWTETGVAADGKTPQQLFPLTSADESATDTSGNGISVKPISFYDQAADKLTATCTVSLKFPDGTTGSVTAMSTPVTFVKPTVTKWLTDTGYAQPSPKYGYFPLLPAPGTGFPGGEYWHDVTITVPQPFSGGLGCFAQIITPDFEMFQDGSTSPAADPNNKVQGLDNHFPYVSYQWTVPALGTQSDTPAIGVPGVNVPQYQGWNTATRHDQFTTWVMYKPPAFGTQGAIWVPLQSYSWDWSCTIQWLNNQWTITASNPSATTRAPARTPVDAPTPPAWSFAQTNGS